MPIENVAIIGAGQMGAGIAQVAAKQGKQVTLHDVKEELVERGKERIAKSLGKEVEKERITEGEKEEILARIHPSINLKEAADADIVIEAASENTEIKKKIFQDLDRLTGKETILATNTSSISITELAAVTGRPEKVIGMHFFNPVPVMKLVEVIRGLTTDDQTFTEVRSLAEELGKEPVDISDYPGFAANRILVPMINEAIYCVYEGVASPEDVDKVMKLGANHPLGPLALADLIGLDTCLSIMEVLHDGFGDSKYRPCPLLYKYVNAGWLGRKTGRGFFSY
ncbi:3-hydroxybutyryl-CoA dehydrogenase [Thalassobacillus sp. C254]|uniref:3-hydroxybutyryl-CoA dehydrogenase n=1 Tax=Thalassobacillus sp. C254 TaxID=1225341 RepID=UPI0006D0E07C|nr:3-hydroxybutyryl-CoA dehydrogenase [Thalassobacillus sp. C254]